MITAKSIRFKRFCQHGIGLGVGVFLLINGARGVELRGRVIDTAGNPVPGAKVELLGKNHVDSADNDGRFSMFSGVGNLQRAENGNYAKSAVTLRGNRLVFENSQKAGFEFELFSPNGRRLYQLKKYGLPPGAHRFVSPFEKIGPGLYIARIKYPEYCLSETKSLLKSNNQLTVITPTHALTKRSARTASVLDTLMIYKSGFKIAYKPLTAPDAVLGDITLYPAGTDKTGYIVFSRNDLSSGALPATAAWAYDPVTKTLVKKLSFEKSSWAPDFLLSDEPAQAPCYVRHQVPAPTGSVYGYTTTLYKIDYATWNSTIVAKADQIIGIESNAQLVYLKINDRYCILNRQSDHIDTMENFNLISMVNDQLLINHDRNDSAYLFSTLQNSVIADAYSPRLFSGNDRYVVSNDHRFLAQYKALTGGMSYGQTVLAKSEIILFNLEKDSAYVFPIAVYCAGGSGVPIIYRSLDVSFSGDSCLRYLSAIDGNDTQAYRTLSDSAMLQRCEMISINLQTGIVTKLPVPQTQRPAFVLRYVPPYLESQREKILSNEDLIQAFLQRLGFTEEISYDVGISPDGKRFLGRFCSTNAATGCEYTFIYGDMENNWAQRLSNQPQNLINPPAEIYIHGIE